MCISSFIGDDYANKHPYRWPGSNDTVPADNPFFKLWPPKGLIPHPNEVEIERLKKELEELKILLMKANEFDAEHNEPHCEVEEKIETIKNHGEHLGVDFTEVFDKNALPEAEPETPYEPFKVISPEGLVARFATRQLAEKFVQYLAAYTRKDSVEFQIGEVTRINIDSDSLNFGVFQDSKLIAAFDTNQRAVNFILDLNVIDSNSSIEIKII